MVHLNLSAFQQRLHDKLSALSCGFSKHSSKNLPTEERGVVSRARGQTFLDGGDGNKELLQLGSASPTD